MTKLSDLRFDAAPRHVIFVVVIAALLASCGDRAAQTAQTAPEAQVTAPVPASDPAPSAKPAVALVEPVAVSLNSGTGVLPTDPSWEALLETLPPHQRHELTALNARHFGVLRFQNEEERRKLEELGIPTPDDVLEAAKLTDGELKARADAGDVQAQMLLVDRLTSQAEALFATRASESAAFDRVSAQAFVEMNMLAARHKQSPFGPYLEGRLNWKLKSGQSPEVMAASLMVAADKGDWRAKTWLTQFQRQNPQMDAAETVMIYDTLRRGWRVP